MPCSFGRRAQNLHGVSAPFPPAQKINRSFSSWQHFRRREAGRLLQLRLKITHTHRPTAWTWHCTPNTPNTPSPLLYTPLTPVPCPCPCPQFSVNGSTLPPVQSTNSQSKKTPQPKGPPSPRNRRGSLNYTSIARFFFTFISYPLLSSLVKKESHFSSSTTSRFDTWIGRPTERKQHPISLFIIPFASSLRPSSVLLSYLLSSRTGSTSFSFFQNPFFDNTRPSSLT